MTGDLAGRRILVTGGASGMGAASVRAFARAGARVFSVDLDAENGARVAEQATRDNRGGSGGTDNVGTGGVVMFEECNVADAGARAVLERGIDWLGGLDVLANVAGVERAAAPEEMTEEQLDFMLEINLWSTIQANQVAYEHMRAHGGGRIINYASDAGLGGMPDAPGYSASKGGVLGWSRAIAMEWAGDGIAVIAMCPVIWTPMYEAYRERHAAAIVAASDTMMQGSDPDLHMGPVMAFLAHPESFGIYAQHLRVTKPPGMVA